MVDMVMTERRLRSIESLIDNYGAHLVPVQDDKSPVRGFRTNWHTRMPDFKTIYPHARRGGAFGLIPHSIGMVVFDWDDDDLEAAAAFSTEHPSELLLPTPRGWHFYFTNYQARANAQWQYQGKTRGDVRSASGYAIMHGNAPILIDQCMTEAPKQLAFPEHLIGKAPEPEPIPQEAPQATSAPQKSQSIPQDISAVNWRSVGRGARNTTLYRAVHELAYNAPVKAFSDRASFTSGLIGQAREWAALMPDWADFSYTEVQAIVEGAVADVGKWRALPGIRNARYTSEQRKRGGVRSGQRRRWLQRERDAEIEALRGQGLNPSGIAAQVGVSKATINRILKQSRKLAEGSEAMSFPKEAQKRGGIQSGIVRKDKMTERDAEVWRLYQDRTLKVSDIAAQVGCSMRTIHNVVKRERGKCNEVTHEVVSGGEAS